MILAARNHVTCALKQFGRSGINFNLLYPFLSASMYSGREYPLRKLPSPPTINSRNRPSPPPFANPPLCLSIHLPPYCSHPSLHLCPFTFNPSPPFYIPNGGLCRKMHYLSHFGPASEPRGYYRKL